MPNIYLDYATTTYTDPKVLEFMFPYFTEKYGNPESLHSKGKEAMIAIDEARETVATILGCRASEIFFTGSATEANNLAIFGITKANKEKGKHVITSLIEHPSVKNPFLELEKQGYEVTWLKVDKEGFVNPQDVEITIRPDTILVSVMYANNEIGTIEPITEIGKICRAKEVPFHTDACQVPGALSLNVEELQVDSMTLNGSKIYGPKGVGALYVKKGIPIEAITLGGQHEKGLRAGTHNTPSIVGFAKALELTQIDAQKESARLNSLRDKLINGILKNTSGANLNGTKEKRLPNNASILFEGINAQELMLQLDEAGIFISTGSACTTGSKTPSAVLQAIGIPQALTHSTIRFSLGKSTTDANIDYVIKTLPPIVEKLRINHGFKTL